MGYHDRAFRFRHPPLPGSRAAREAAQNRLMALALFLATGSGLAIGVLVGMVLAR